MNITNHYRYNWFDGTLRSTEQCNNCASTSALMIEIVHLLLSTLRATTLGSA